MFKGNTILVTGGTGSFGKKFISIILKEYNPKKGPYSFDKLKKAGLGDVFIEYMRLWKGFVLDES